MHLKNTKIVSYQNIIIFASIIPIIIFGFLTYYNSKEERFQAAFGQIKSLNTQKKQIVKEHFDTIKFHTKELTTTVSFLQKQAMNNIINIENLQKNHLQKYYSTVENEILSLASKDIYQYIYSFLNRSKVVDQDYLDNIYAYKEGLGIKNILMINQDGKIIYSSNDERLLNKNAEDLTNTFESIWNNLKNNPKKLEVSFSRPSYNEITGTYQQYAISTFKDVDGYIAMEINQNDIQKIISNVSSLGKTAETYLIYKEGKDTYLASNREKKTGKIGDAKSGKFINKGFTHSGVDIKYGSLGEIELIGYMPVSIKNMTFSMQTTVSYTEVISPIISGSDYFEKYMKDHDYHNIMLIGPNGKIFYSITKESDYKTNILTGVYANTGLSQGVKKVFKSKKFVLTDIFVYKACMHGLSQIALFPLLRKDGSIQSIIGIEIKHDKLNKKLAATKSNYKTYDAYLVGEDYRLRSDTLLNKDKHNVDKSFKDNVLVQTEAVKLAFANKNTSKILKDYRDVSVLSSFDTLEYEGFRWAIISEVDEEEIETMLSALKYNILFFILISSVVALVVMLLITNQKKKQDKDMKYTATHDELTGLPNRKFALEFLAYILANSRRNKTKGAVLFIDLDKFKIINDSYGHTAGDVVLKEVARRLKKVLRSEDLIARLGGDEFVVIINNYKTIHDIDTLCQKMIKSISEQIDDEKRYYQVGISIGIATFPNDSDNEEELLQFSDTAMFQTKDNGRNGFTYYSKEMTEKSLQISRVERELKNAIAENQLTLFYQPQVNITTTKVVGVEALVRWNHPVDGLVMPNDFIPIAEESNLILDLGHWVAYEACKNFKKWKDDGSDLEYIAVNMSTKQLQCSRCVENIQNIIDTLDFKPEWLELEITETTLISNLENTLINIEHFKSMGIKFSIDDFGTGYSSLAYLKSLRISTLKIDRVFIKDMIEDMDDRAIVQAIILMGHTLNYTIVAEGAETMEEVELLKTFDCDIVQGYHYSKPLPENELLKYISERNNAE